MFQIEPEQTGKTTEVEKDQIAQTEKTDLKVKENEISEQIATSNKECQPEKEVNDVVESQPEKVEDVEVVKNDGKIEN